MMAGKRIVVIGGGTGGIVLANQLRGRLAIPHRITVVERSETHTFAASFLWLMVGHRRRLDVTRPLRRLLRGGVDLLVGEAREIDPKERLVRVGSETIGYDLLVLASGTEMSLESIPGLAAAETFFTLDGAERLQTVLREFRGGKVALVVASTPYKCPGAPAEGAMLIRDFLRQRSVHAEIDLYTPEPQPMPVAGPQLGEAVRSMLAERGVGYHPGHTLLSAHGENLVFKEREPLSADLVVAIPRHFPPRILRTAGVTNDAGWAVPDPRTLATGDPSIFAIGDCASIPLPGRWSPGAPLFLPKAGVFAHAQALALADRLAAEIEGKGQVPDFCADGFCMLEAGEQLAGFAYGDFYATPVPEIHLRNVGKAWHVAKVLFEQWWLATPGLRKSALASALRVGGKLYSIPVAL
ncbi:MAG: NAD(P)/FAD-dependent oxidoreductase [Acidithiobacillales bacterium]